MKKNIVKSFLTLFFLLLHLAKADAQEASAWKTLSKITFRKQYDELMGFKVDYPVFSDDVKKLNGKTIELKGYIIPTDGYKSHTEFVFSAFPYNMCFFCGGAGPETVMEVRAKSPIKYTTEPIVLRGTLRLNEKDINRLMYSIEGAVRVADGK